ncbi:MBL fold metallo-hydrolase [Selenomonas sp. WCT3]|uniref:MBL fold metallo-hydrolase n=1 Tax=Selenomonas sp. WCT3 TaxID=3158785 RepID=UPI00094343D8
MNSFSRFVLRYSESNMYLLVENHEALIIDPHKSMEALAVLREKGVKHIHILLTHEHFDHVTGVNWLKEQFNTTVICQKKCAESIAVAKNNRPFVFFPMVEDKTEQEKREIISFFDALPADAIKADITFAEEYDFTWQGHEIKLVSCPGHSPGSTLINFDNIHVFTGDYVIPNTPVILRFPGGDKEIYRKKTLPVLLGMSDDLMMMPGHGEPCLRGSLTYECGCFMKYEN